MDLLPNQLSRQTALEEKEARLRQTQKILIPKNSQAQNRPQTVLRYAESHAPYTFLAPEQVEETAQRIPKDVQHRGQPYPLAQNGPNHDQKFHEVFTGEPEPGDELPVEPYDVKVNLICIMTCTMQP